MTHANRMKHKWYEHRGDTEYYYQSNVNMMLLLVKNSEHNELLKKNIKHTYSTKIRSIAMEHAPSEDSIKSDNVSEYEEKTKREEVKQPVEAAKMKDRINWKTLCQHMFIKNRWKEEKRLKKKQ